MKNILTKKSVFLIGIVGVALFFLIDYLDGIPFCRAYFDYWACGQSLEVIINTLSLFFSLLLFSLITYFLPEKVFRSWVHFAVWWTPLSMLLTSLTPNGGGSWGMPNVLDQEMVAFLTSALFITISLITIIVSFMRNRTKKGATL
jgi:hypothetical protein